MKGGTEKEEEQVVPVKVIPRGILEAFYMNAFSLALEAVIYDLGTCCGRFQLFQREIAPRIDTFTGASYHRRSDVYRTLADVTGMIKVICPTTLQFGGIYPAHHIPAHQPVMQNERLEPRFELNKDFVKPREVDRQVVFQNHCASPLGEVIIDMDMCAEYNRKGICNCADDQVVCDTCWQVFFNPAQMVLDHIYKYFGLTATFRVFSGRRGFHDWLINKRMIYMTASQRQSFFEAIQGRNLVPGSDLCESIYRMLAPLFDQNPVLTRRFEESLQRGGGVLSKRELHRRAVFDALYPKMDRSVTVDATHLHKIPLCLHPTTGNLCEVILGGPGTMYEFVPSEDAIHYGRVTTKHMEIGLMVIKRALAIASKEV